jgi:hypothetical protein
LRVSKGSRRLLSKGRACGCQPRRRRTVPSSCDPSRAAAVIDGSESRDLKHQQRARRDSHARRASGDYRDSRVRLPKTGLVRAPACLGTDLPAQLHRQQRRVIRCTSGDRDGGLGRPVLYLPGEMPEELPQRVGAADDHVAGTDRWHLVAVTNPMFSLKLETPRGEGTRPSSVGSVLARGEARSRCLTQPDGSDRKRHKDTSRLAHQSRAQATVPGGARAPR